MRRRRGFTLAEMLVLLVVLFAAVNLIAVMLYDLHASYDRVRTMLDDVETASRLLRDVKDDLRRASKAVPGANRLTLGFENEPETTYELLPSDGSVLRRTGGDTVVYAFAFSRLSVSREGGRMMAVEVELRKHDPDSPMRPRIGTRVFCRNVDK